MITYNNIKYNIYELLIITAFYPEKDIGSSPWSERYSGLYLYSLYKYKNLLQKHNYNVLWYSIRDSKLRRPFEKNKIIKKLNNYMFFIKEIICNKLYNKSKVYIIANPLFRNRYFIKVLFFLLTIYFLKNNNFIIIDLVDSLVMMNKQYINNKIYKIIFNLFAIFAEKQLLTMANKIIVTSDNMILKLKNEYNLDNNKFIVIPMGIHVNDYDLSLKEKDKHKFSVFYGGVISSDRGFDNLLICMDKINQFINIELICCGRIDKKIRVIDKPWLKIYSNISYKEYVDIIVKNADIGIIPYPKNEWWDNVSISKVATYAAAGIAIVTTNLDFTAKFVKYWDCGYVAKSWEEIYEIIIFLANNKDICKFKGNNARQAAEKTLDWRVLSFIFT